MLKKLLSSTAMLLGVISFVGAAQAADLPQKPVKLVTYQKQKDFDGFYLRGDVGYVTANGPSTNYGGFIPFVNENLEDTWLAGGGIGYAFNQNFRTDITVDYQFKSKFYGNTVCVSACVGNGLSDEYSKFSATTALANAYYDIGTFSGFTPYIGAGVGMAHVKFDALRSFNPDGSATVIPGDSRWGLAYAAMAGGSYTLTNNILLDANYRFLVLDEGRTQLDSINNRVTFKDITEHQVRVGLRYLFQ